MKKTIYAIAFIAFSIVSCDSDNNVDPSTDNLIDISNKLEKLQVKDIQPSTTTEEILLDDGSDEFKKNISHKTSFEDCNHKEVYSENYNDIIYTSTSYYFDKEGNEITNCDSYILGNYILKEELKTVGSDYEYNLSSTTNFEEINIETNENLYYKSSQKSDFTGTLNFDSDIFNVVSGSSANLLVEYNISLEDVFNEYSDNEDPGVSVTMDILYKMEFDVNNQTYHFDMTLSEEEILSIDNLEESDNTGFELEYDLFNSADEKIGTIKYLQDYNTEKEWFEVYNLDGNKI